jgi:methyl-accepting chemotaxis protein|nr:hypothetical protein [uncultured Romboutsia sp.]DAM61421.1 MAG TPA: protein of unknown function (DUF948) [Caudoviricetes sp.]
MTIEINTYYIIPLLIFFFSITFFGLGVLITSFNLNKSLKSDQNNQEQVKHDIFNALTKKDMAYWFVILMFFIIFWVSSYLYNDTDLVSYIGFSGTIVSIFLGVVAIIYSYFQTADNSSTQKELSKTLYELNKASSNIADSVNKFSTLESKISSLSEELKQTHDTLNAIKTDINSKFEETNENIRSVTELKTTSTSTSNNDWDDIPF